EQEAVGAVVNQPDLDRQVTLQTARHRSGLLVTGIDNNPTGSTRLGLPQSRQVAQIPSDGQLLQKCNALTSFQLAVGSLPIQQFRNRVGQLMQGQVRKIQRQLVDQLNVLSRNLSSTKGNLGAVAHKHGVLCEMPCLSYKPPNEMSSEKWPISSRGL